ncbi:MAG: tryptophan 7-halogenase [Calothrix sp. MO_167.B12]|nr:tryptophan 7-halogenase [Calothrix sp. MO_167.B12]
MNNPIEKIVIVGGGTAGWLSALYLTTVLNHQSKNPRLNCQITLIESPTIPTVGVGEATIQNIRETFSFLDLDEEELIIRCNATFKLAIKFIDWYSGTNNDIFWHPFGEFPTINGIYLPHYLLRQKLLGNSSALDSHSFHREVPLCTAKKSPKIGSENPYEGKVAYGYHLDAGLLSTYLQEKAIERGVNHVGDNVVDVVLAVNGNISKIKTEKSGDINGDLFIDCSGFRGILINQALKEPFISYSDSLFCDRAIAIPIETDDEKEGINPYTTAKALSAGWMWHTPLFGRSGNGYVYSSAFISPESAEKEFRENLNKGSRQVQVDARHIRMRVGKNRNTWVKNCVSIGLSSGFIEPLESTGIYLIEVGVKTLLQHLPDKSFNPVSRDRYNQLMTKVYEEIRDFIVLHYCTTHREDTPFWKENKYHPAIPDSLQEKLEVFQAALPNLDFWEKHSLFEDYSYFCILAGMKLLPLNPLPILNYVDTSEAEDVLLKIKTEAEIFKNTLPDHYEYILQLHQGSIRGLRNLFGNNYQHQIKALSC